jgi:hypothetical protein
MSTAATTFRDLFESSHFSEFTHVEIPIIQRDYAQGRASEREVRTEFLADMHKVLSRQDGSFEPPLDLGFVFGTVAGKAFCPLDGQQRLTTLFLLHWYLACRDRESDKFRQLLQANDKCRFSYKVRRSSEEFFDALVGMSFDLTKLQTPDKSADGIDQRNSFSKTLIDSPQFFLSWLRDPTVQSALTMLDDIHNLFKDSRASYQRVTQTDHPYVTFQFMKLDDFGLTDDLYIKMNARGKPLTAFEAFKAKLEQFMGEILPNEIYLFKGQRKKLRDHFSQQVDGTWTDLFWIYRDKDKKPNLFDEQIMIFVRAVAIVTRNSNAVSTNEALRALTARNVPFSFPKYHEHGCIDAPFIKGLITVLDECVGETDGKLKTHLRDTAYYDEEAIFKKVLNGPVDLAELLQFQAYCAYICKNRDDLREDSFWEWMRVITNLAENTNTEFEAFTRCVRSVNELLDKSTSILEHLSVTDLELPGFNPQQVREERLKAQLMLRSDAWRSRIQEAEQHGYFRGQIEFLLKFSGVLDRWQETKSCTWSESDDVEYRKSFTDYFIKASKIFSADGLNDFGEHRWERALLVIGDYLLQKGSGHNYSFLDNPRSSHLSWKRLLRGAAEVDPKPDDFFEKRRCYVKDLFMKWVDVTTGVAEFLDSVIGHAAQVTVPWRRILAEKPAMISFCKKRLIQYFGDENVYLLRGERISGAHAELFTYDLYIGLLLGKHDKGDLVPFSKPQYNEHQADDPAGPPCVFLEFECVDGIIVLGVCNQNGKFELQLFNRKGALPANMKEALKSSAAFVERDNEKITQTVDWSKIEDTIDGVVAVIRRLAKQSHLSTSTPNLRMTD